MVTATAKMNYLLIVYKGSQIIRIFIRKHYKHRQNFKHKRHKSTLSLIPKNIKARQF